MGEVRAWDLGVVVFGRLLSLVVFVLLAPFAFPMEAFWPRCGCPYLSRVESQLIGFWAGGWLAIYRASVAKGYDCERAKLLANIGCWVPGLLRASEAHHG